MPEIAAELKNAEVLSICFMSSVGLSGVRYEIMSSIKGGRIHDNSTMLIVKLT